VRAVLLWDNAPYHVSGELVVPANVSLIGLLPYSPELNPVENLWHYLRSHHWSNRVYDDYDALLEAATEAWRQVCLDPEKIRSICAAPYLTERI
jgi:transposase